ncbi:MAG TPA: PIN domain-containing protein [Mycobacteriales bacterium]|nr:PIN domain-containing protein [Mycobacteriales bacterium]
MTPLALDTSAAVPLVVATHAAHAAVTAWCSGRAVALAGHAAVETYAVLTRLPGDLRVAPRDAARLLEARFTATLQLDPDTQRRLPALLADHAIAGGAAYDAVVALAARDAGARLATRDGRALGTYQRLGIAVDVVG